MIKLDLKNFIAGGRLSLSNTYIKSVAEKMLADFCPAALDTPQAVDVDRFITEYLGFKLRYEWLTHNGSILGMTNYTADTLTFYDPANNDIVKKPVDENTVILDARMAGNVNKGRYTYTAGHECGHIVFDNPNVRQHREESRLLMMECAEDFGASAAYHTGETLTSGKLKDDGLWTEHYCDRFASCFLMPEKAAKAATIDVFRKNGIKSDCFYPHTEADGKLCIDIASEIAQIFETSKEAAMYKLCDLKLIRGGREIFENMTRYRKR